MTYNIIKKINYQELNTFFNYKNNNKLILSKYNNNKFIKNLVKFTPILLNKKNKTINFIPSNIKIIYNYFLSNLLKIIFIFKILNINL